MAFSTASASSASAEINVTPLIDVLLVLLIIFMVIVPLKPRGLESQLPQESKTAQPTVGPVSLRLVGGGGETSVRYEVDGKDVERGRLEEALVASLSVRSNRSVYVAASPDVSYRLVAEAVGVAKGAGANTVGLGRLVPHS